MAAAMALRTPAPAPTTFAPVPRLVNVARQDTYTYLVGLTIPLTTPWTEPASCATNIPTIQAGTCDTDSCSAYDATDIPGILYSYGASVNYPDFTTSQLETSTACMPPGYENIESMYFVGRTNSFCSGIWTTATVDTAEAPTETVVCCPTEYPSATSFDGNGRYDCYTMMSVTSGQQFVLAAQGYIETDRPAGWPTAQAFVPSWVSESIIGTTTWTDTATTAMVSHPAINWLVDGEVKTGGASASATQTGGAGGGQHATISASVPTVSASFSLFHLSKTASIGIAAAIGIAGLLVLLSTCLCFWCLCFRRRGRDRPGKPPVVYNPVPEQYPLEQQYGVPPPGKYEYPQQSGYGYGG